MRQNITKTIVNWLFKEGNLSLNIWEWTILFLVMFIKNDPPLRELFFNDLKQKIETALANPALTPTQKEIILHSALSWIAFAMPQENQTLNIHQVPYSIKKIPLTSGWLSSPYYAYGLRPINNSDAPSFLIFQGTTTPTDRGFLAGVLADTMPHGAIGTHLYRRGRAQIQAWINTEYQRSGKPVLCSGQSLGGAMCLHAHIHQPDKVDFFVINPPYLTRREKRIYERHAPKDRQHRTLKVMTHCNDPVRILGSQYLPRGTKVGIYGHHQDNFMVAHTQTADCQSGRPEIEFKAYHEQINQNRHWKMTRFLLFMIVCTLHGIALPARICLNALNKISEKNRAPNLPLSTEVPDMIPERLSENKQNPSVHYGSLFKPKPDNTHPEPMELKSPQI